MLDESLHADLYERYHAQVYRCIAARVPRSEVEDLVADSFVKALASNHAVSYPGSWLQTIARNLAQDWWKRRGSREELGDIAERAGWHQPAMEADLYFKRALGFVLRTMQLLDPKYSGILYASAEGKPDALIAQELEVSLAAVKSRLHRGRNFLRQAYFQEFEEELEF